MTAIQRRRLTKNCPECRKRRPNSFCDLPEAVFAELSGLMICRQYTRGSAVFVEGQPPKGVYILCSGPAKLSAYSEEGKAISGGQRQRLGIARAMYTNPEILILDEATSALDGVTEKEISSEIIGLKGVKTLVVIAHRLSTIRNADIIYYLEEGRIQASGTFEELRSMNRNFAKQAESMGI